MKHIINIVMGAPSNDGHGRTDFITIETNFSKEAIVKAYTQGTEILGVDFINSVCAEYEDCQIQFSLLEKLH
jgi:hypothetical protein